MVIPRAASLAVEGGLATAALVAFVALVAGGSAAGRIARRAATAGALAALVAALLTLRQDDTWLFDALRIDTTTQTLKAFVAAGLLVSLRGTTDVDGFARTRAAQPFFSLVAAAALVAAAGAADLLVLWLALDVACAAMVIVVATGGRWSVRERAVRQLLVAWLPASLVLMFGTLLAAGVTGATRYADLEILLPEVRSEPVIVTAVGCIVAGIAARAAGFVLVLSRLGDSPPAARTPEH